MAVKRISIKDQAYDIVKNKIIKGEFGLGDTINMVHLSEELNTSNTPIREALSQLEAEGLIVRATNSKYQVVSLTEDELSELNMAVLIQLKGALEICIAREKLDDLVELLHQSLKAQEDLFESEYSYDYLMASIAFDRCIVYVSGNKKLISIFDLLSSLLALSTAYSQKHTRQKNLNEHKQILLAIESGDIKKAFEQLENHYDKHLPALRD